MSEASRKIIAAPGEAKPETVSYGLWYRIFASGMTGELYIEMGDGSATLQECYSLAGRQAQAYPLEMALLKGEALGVEMLQFYPKLEVQICHANSWRLKRRIVMEVTNH